MWWSAALFSPTSTGRRPFEPSAVRAASSAKKTYGIELVRDRKPVTVNVTVEDRSERWIPRGRVVTNSIPN